jgi:hypothetical protein
MVHRAILGSGTAPASASRNVSNCYYAVERFLAILLEHTAGKLPLWLSPRQVMVVASSNPFYLTA